MLLRSRLVPNEPVPAESKGGPFLRQGSCQLSARPGSETLMHCWAWALPAPGCVQPPGQLELRSWLHRLVSLPSWQALLMRCGLGTDLSHVINSVLCKVGGFVGWHQDGDNCLARRQEMTSYWQWESYVCSKQVIPALPYWWQPSAHAPSRPSTASLQLYSIVSCLVHLCHHPLSFSAAPISAPASGMHPEPPWGQQGMCR